jgi:hypothetical protein
MSGITQILSQIEGRDDQAAEQLSAPAVIRRLQHMGLTIQLDSDAKRGW